MPKKRGVPVGTTRPDFNKDGTPRKKPGPKPGRNINNTPSAQNQDAHSTISATVQPVNPTAKKRGGPKGTKRGLYNKDRSLRQKPGRKPKKVSQIINAESSLASQEKQIDITSTITPGDTTAKKRGVPKSTKRGIYNKDVSLRQKPGRKLKM